MRRAWFRRYKGRGNAGISSGHPILRQAHDRAYTDQAGEIITNVQPGHRNTYDEIENVTRINLDGDTMFCSCNGCYWFERGLYCSGDYSSRQRAMRALSLSIVKWRLLREQE